MVERSNASEARGGGGMRRAGGGGGAGEGLEWLGLVPAEQAGIIRAGK